MKITRVTPRGYCKGVVRAIEIAKKTALEYPDKQVYILGMLVHNKYVIQALEKYNIITLDDKQKSRMELLDEIDDGVVIFTAHGIHEKVKEKAIQKRLIVIDASCPDVLSTQALVHDYVNQGYQIIYVGKRNHPEATAICDYNNNIHLIENIQDVAKLPQFDKVFVTNQTTMSIYDIKDIFAAIEKRYPHAVFTEEICNATRIRQEAIAQLDDIDVLIIVGDKASNNSNRLAQIGKERGIETVLLIDDVNDLDIAQFGSSQSIAVSAGASTPTYLTNQVIHCLEQNNTSFQNIEIDKII